MTEFTLTFDGAGYLRRKPIQMKLRTAPDAQFGETQSAQRAPELSFTTVEIDHTPEEMEAHQRTYKFLKEWAALIKHQNTRYAPNHHYHLKDTPRGPLVIFDSVPMAGIQFRGRRTAHMFAKNHTAKYEL